VAPDVADEADLLAAARAGDADALGRLIDRFRLYLLSIADAELTGQVRPKVLPSDVVQDAFLEAVRIFDRFGGVRAEELRAWLRAILLNKVSQAHNHYLGAAKRNPDRERPLADAADAVPVADPTPSGEALRAEETRGLLAALERLPEAARQVIVWRNWDGLPFAEIGHRLGRTEDAARMQFVRAVERLEQELARAHPGGPD
jgi:RNA polymerase sigma-70 factor (ECF subfamily)